MSMTNQEKTPLAVDMDGVHFAWRKAHAPVLTIERLSIARGERVFIVGPSGSGKSTLLSLIAGILVPLQGTIRVGGVLLNALNSAGRDRFRADHIGFIHQMFNLIPYLSVRENVTLPCRFSPSRRRKSAEGPDGLNGQALHLLEKLGMNRSDLIDKPATELSVGQQQRVAAARAMIGAPELIIADEPTSSLDADHRAAFVRLLFNECDRQATTLVFVSHDTTLQTLFDRTIRLDDINVAGASHR
ncbi:MAG: ABC transporter ATP-binding protein [Desulfatitalea sp.]|nr:ABC transporter ATP-binding protein [Desulfatitalea sp.]